MLVFPSFSEYFFITFLTITPGQFSAHADRGIEEERGIAAQLSYGISVTVEKELIRPKELCRILTVRTSEVTEVALKVTIPYHRTGSLLRFKKGDERCRRSSVVEQVIRNH